MRLRRSPRALALVVMLACGPALADEAVVIWDQANADAHGSGCSADDTAFITAGNELTVVFSGLGVSLDGPGANAANKRCVLVIPVRMATGGWHIRALHESLLYGYIRSDGADGSVAVSSHLFGLKTGRLGADIPGAGEDPEQEPFLALSATTEVQPHGSPCNQGHRHGNYTAQLDVSAHRRDKDAQIAIEIAGQDLRLDLSPELEADDCAR